MRIAILHLSDIHFHGLNDAVLKRAKNIASATMSVAPNPDAYLLAVTGDVAFSGKTEQYELAGTFFKEIKQHLANSKRPIFEFFVPGNHDLDFDAEPDTRPALLQTLPDRIESIDPNGETVRQIVSVQEGFFEFQRSMETPGKHLPHSPLVYSYVFPVVDKKIQVNCFNTAWVSTNPEIPGQLVFPTAAIDIKTELAELVISAFHHPYNWLSPENGRSFRNHVESTSDVIMTGHEHESSIYVKQYSDSATAQYIEGAILQGSSKDPSGFNVVVVDTGAGMYEAFLCQWEGAAYNQSSCGVNQFVRNKLVCRSVFRNTPDFLSVLSDPGLPVLHPLKHEIKLEDLFIYPALARKDPDNKFAVLRIIESQNVVEFIRATPHILIFGEDISGKTSFAKRLYRDLPADGGLVPVLVRGEEFTGYKGKDVRRALENAVVNQYGEASTDAFFQLDHYQRVVIIDDWHKLRYAAKGRVSILESLKVFCGKIVLFTSRLYAFEELAEIGPIRDALADFQFCDIKEFGKRLTGKLIEKWHSLGRDYSNDVREYNYLVASSEQKISALIGKGVLPTYPIFLLGLLQADASPTSPQSAGSYGHILEAVITTRLANVSTRSANIGLVYTYASRIAYSLFKKARPFLSSKEVHQLHREYCDAYQMKLSENKVISDLIKAKILCQEGDSYRFTYKGCYFYFVARYISENLGSHESELRSELNEMTDRLGWEDYANIIMFFLYLTRDQKIIERLLANAARMYEEWEPSDLEKDVRFVNDLLTEKPKKLLLPLADIESNRDQYRSKQDEVESKFENRDEAAPDQRVPYDPSLDEIMKLTIALQNLRVMGQVMRNFPGVLKAEPIYRLAEASYSLGLRMLRRLLALAEQNLEGLRTAFAQLFKERHPLATTEEMENSADQKLIWLTGAVSYGMIKRICCSVGHEELELTFEQVRKRLGEKTSIRLIDLAIQLEYFREAREADIYDLEKDVQKNHFAYKILRDLVSEFLYLHNTDSKVFQRLGDEFEIETSDPKFRLNKAIGTTEGKLLQKSAEI
jgi:hypothetical protein